MTRKRSVPLGANPLRFPPGEEQDFQHRYYENGRLLLRSVTLLLSLLFLAYAGRDYADTKSVMLALTAHGAPSVFFLLIFGFSFSDRFEHYWLPTVTVLGLIVATISLSGLSQFIHGSPAAVTTFEGLADAFPGGQLFYTVHLCILMVSFAVLRPQFFWALALESGILLIGLIFFITRLAPVLENGGILIAVSRLLQPTLLVLFGVLLAAFVQDHQARSAFTANRHLDQLRDLEHRKLLETENMLHVLNGAIGSIVHDLGNPLTLVQSSASTLAHLTQKRGTTDELQDELTRMISDGAEMLDFLRLSLIEQTRVLEGMPQPVEPAPTTIRTVVGAGARYQKAGLGQKVVIEGEDHPINVDARRLTTVFMNLIGNALKYSDGEVAVQWRAPQDRLLIAILDSGSGGQGLTFEQAKRLFRPFERLENSHGLEGTGLGLVSAQKVVEAHGGEIFIQGYEGGMPGAAPYSTSRQTQPVLIDVPFRTAFVVALPLA